jgi:protein-S-isoprenylcysteine O-methyltransferase Ste14
MRTAAAVPAAAHAFAWGGALAFFASLSFFLYSYGVTFGEIVDVSPADCRAATATNVVLFTIFALHHSVFARERVRRWVGRVVPPYLERAWYVWVASVLFVAVCLWWQPVGGVAWRLDGAWRWLALGVQGAGIWLTLHSAAIIDIFELSGVRQLSPREAPIEFKTSGPYGWVRHPIYTGWFLLVFAAPTMTMTRLVFAMVSSAYLLLAIPFEERSIRASSAGAYETYARRVRWKLIPGVY